MRVVLTGSESTGKSTLAADLARQYDAPLVPEFVRGYAEQRGGVIEFGDHGPIARGQIALEDEYIARGGRLLVQDTDLLSTVVYCRHYFGRCPAWIEETAASRRPALYLLCEIDVPWVADGVRDRGDRREEMQSLFRDEVRASGVRSVALVGDHATRLLSAIAAIDSALSRGPADPSLRSG
jgi:NadR type nicotinamide-nucleotide adenylyltransferase